MSPPGAPAASSSHEARPSRRSMRVTASSGSALGQHQAGHPGPGTDVGQQPARRGEATGAGLGTRRCPSLDRPLVDECADHGANASEWT